MEFNDDLKIDLLPINLELKRATNHAPSRERVTGEKYFRQKIQIYNKSGKLVDSGFIQINDYTNMCKMVRVCNEFTTSYHIFELWEHFGTQFYKTTKYRIIDLATGNYVATIESIYLDYFIEKTQTKNLCIVGDLVKDEYSKILLECLDEYSKSNEPENVKSFRNTTNNDKCSCNLFEHLNINELFRNGEIDENKRDLLIDSLDCNCKISLADEVLSEEKKNIIAEMRIRAQAEIEEVLSIKELEKDVANMV